MTNCKETLEYYSRKESEKRKLVYPAIYKHFKHTEDGGLNNYMYATIGISEPLESEELLKLILHVAIVTEVCLSTSTVCP